METSCHHLLWHFLFAITTYFTICFDFNNRNNIVFRMYIEQSLCILDDSLQTSNWSYNIFMILALQFVVHIHWTYANLFHLKNIKHCTRRYTWDVVQSRYAYNKKASIIFNNMINYELVTLASWKNIRTWIACIYTWILGPKLRSN